MLDTYIKVITNQPQLIKTANPIFDEISIATYLIFKRHKNTDQKKISSKENRCLKIHFVLPIHLHTPSPRYGIKETPRPLMHFEDTLIRQKRKRNPHLRTFVIGDHVLIQTPAITFPFASTVPFVYAFPCSPTLPSYPL